MTQIVHTKLCEDCRRRPIPTCQKYCYFCREKQEKEKELKENE